MEPELEPSAPLSPTRTDPPPPPAEAGCEDDSQHLGSASPEEEAPESSAVAPGDELAGEEAAEIAVEEVGTPPPAAPVKRKRGRPPKARGGGRAPASKRKEKEDEVVCFVCFDGGDLVVCDRRGCPKVYHPGCVNRDNDFFRLRGRWNCGWHICSDCGKAAHYMCYTCTYSLCKTCNGQAGFVCVRGNKGFCETCHATVMMIESNKLRDKNQVEVDFDDKSSWEYLFKEYWLALKGNLSLTLEELSAAKKPRKVSAQDEDSSDESYNANDDQEASSDSSLVPNKESNSSRKKARRRSRNATVHGNSVAQVDTERADSTMKQVDNEGADSSVKQVDNEGADSSVKQVDNEGADSSVKQIDDARIPLTKDIEWASKELLEFVAHMKDGNTSCLSQFDVQALLLEYIKKNNLRDPRRKSQIICDPMLKNLFGKERVGHFEMLKLLELHFLIKEASQVVTDDNQGNAIEPDPGQIDEGYSDAVTKFGSDKRRKTRKRVEEREPQTNLDDYAAIDVHNINLIYLRRSLVEDLIDADDFDEKVIGSFVRIRIPSLAQKQDIYRLVQVLGTSKATSKYKIGKKTTDTVLQVLNLQKAESVTADVISNQEFTEEECQRLRQSIKLGLLNRLTVGEVQEKARVLQAVRVDDWMESEKLRLGHLRDRASEKGRRKELRECVEKLQILTTPEERRRRLNEVPEIHADPKMDPAYESSDEEESDDKTQENYSRSRGSFSHWKGREVLSSGKGTSNPSKIWNSAQKSYASSETNRSAVAEGVRGTQSSNLNGAWKSSSTAWETDENAVSEGARDRVDSVNSVRDRTNESPWAQGTDLHHSGWGTPSTQTNAVVMETNVWNNNKPSVIPGQSYGSALLTMSVPIDGGIPGQPSTSESEKMWHYLDPSGIVQGPFSITQLRKWSTTGYFPPNLRIWRASDKQEDSILLSDALTGKFQKDVRQLEAQQNSFPQSTQFAAAMDSRQNTLGGGWRENSVVPFVDRIPNRGDWNTGLTNATFFGSGGSELLNANRWVNQTSSWSAPKTEVTDPLEGGITTRDWDTSVNGWAGQPQAHSNLKSTAPFSGSNYQPPSHHGRGGRRGNAGRWNRSQDRGSAWNSNWSRGPSPNGQGYERQQSNWGSSGQSSEELWKAQLSNDSKSQWPKSSFNPPSPTLQSSGGSWGNIQDATPGSSQHMGSGWGITPSSGNINASSETVEPNKGAAAKNADGGRFSSSAFMLKKTDKTDSCGPWSTASANNSKDTDGWGNSTTALKQTEKVDGWGPHSGATLAEKDKMAEIVDVPHTVVRTDCLGTEAVTTTFENQLPDCLEGINPSDIAIVVSSSVNNQFSGAVKRNQFLGECPSPTPLCEGECPSPTPLCEREEVVISHQNEVSSPSSAPSLGVADPPVLLSHLDNKFQTVSAIAANEVADKSLANDSEAKNDLLAPSVVEANLACPAATAKRTVESVVLEPVSAQRLGDFSEPKLASESEVWSPLSVPKGEQNGSSPSTAPLKRWKQNQTLKVPDANIIEWSLPSPTPSTKPSEWDTGTNTDSAKNTSWGSSGGFEHSNIGIGTTIGDANMNWGAGVAPADTNVNSTIDWGQPALGNKNATTGSAPRSTNANTGWGPPATESANAKTGWGNDSWGASGQGNSTNPGWGVPAQGNLNPHPGMGSMNKNLGWGAPAPQGNAGGWGTEHGGSNRAAHHNQNDNRYGGGVYVSHDGRTQSGGGGLGRGSSRPPSRGQGQRGICKFHESGFCKKGSSCNYMHT